MSFKDKTLIVIALADEVRIAEARRAGEIVELCSAIVLPSGSRDLNGFALSNKAVVTQFAELVKSQNWTGREALVLVGGSNVSCQYYEVPPIKGQALRQAVELKLSQQLHFEVSQAVIAIDKLKLPSTETGCRVSTAAVHRDSADAVVKAISDARLKLRGITALPASLSWMMNGKLDTSDGMCAGLYVDELQSTLFVSNEGIPCVTSELPIGIAEFTAALLRPIIAGEEVLQLDENQAVEIRNKFGIPKAEESIADFPITGEKILPLIEPALQKLTKQLTQWLTFASTCVNGSQVKSLTLFGPGAHLPNLGNALSRRLKIKVGVEYWLEGAATLNGTVQTMQPTAEKAKPVIQTATAESLAAAVGAVQSSTLPNLLPDEMKREQKVRRIRYSIAITGPLITAAVLAFSILFQRVGGHVSNEIASKQQQLSSMAQIVEQNSKVMAQQNKLAHQEKTIADFSRANPNWTGVFKELSILLPRELKATQYDATPSEGVLSLNVKASVFPGSDGRGFDEIVSQTLQLLQRSPFFSRVELISANRADAAASAAESGAAGTLSLKMEMIYPRARTKA